MYYDFSKRNSKITKSKDKEPPLDKKSKLLIFVAVIVLIVSILGGFGIAKVIQMAQSTPNPTNSNNTELIENNLNTAFLKLELREQNLVYSPLSIKNGLALLEAGAAGNTKTQIEEILGDVIILDKYANINNKLSLANAVFIQDSFKNNVLKSYSAKVNNDYNADIHYDSFADSSTIDSWVDQKTFGLIKNLNLKLNQSTKMVLANALAIQLDWLHQFDTNDTTGHEFTTATGDTIVTTTMSMTTHSEDIHYYIDNDVTTLTLPLEQAGDAKLEFVAVMPKENLSNYIDSLNLTDLKTKLESSISASTVENGVEIYIPKFKFDYELSLVRDLKYLGVTDVFDDSLADFSNMADTPLYVSDAIHKANIDFSEDGIKAAAVTAFTMKVTSALDHIVPQPVIINIDHPFLFLIRDKENGSIWFIGTVYKPNLWADDMSNYR